VVDHFGGLYVHQMCSHNSIVNSFIAIVSKAVNKYSYDTDKLSSKVMAYLPPVQVPPNMQDDPQVL
jgi:hypothetical protein